VVSASGSPGWVGPPTQATYPSGRVSTASGSGDRADHRRFPLARVVGVDHLDATRPRRDVEAAGLTEVEKRGPRIVQQGEHPQGAVGGDQVEIGHPTPEQRLALTEVVLDVQTGEHPGESLARLGMLSGSAIVSLRASVRGLLRVSAVCAMVFCSPRAPTG
jgi:hypothetical protein